MIYLEFVLTFLSVAIVFVCVLLNEISHTLTDISRKGLIMTMVEGK